MKPIEGINKAGIKTQYSAVSRWLVFHLMEASSNITAILCCTHRQGSIFHCLSQSMQGTWFCTVSVYSNEIK